MNRPTARFVLLAAILLLGMALRVHRLEVQSLWYDEAVTAQVAEQGLEELARWTAGDIQPPLYYVLVSAWTRFSGANEWDLRFPSVAAGWLMLPLAYVLGRHLFGSAAGLLATLLAAIHPLWIYYSQEARMYAFLAALGMLAGYALLRVVMPPSVSEKGQGERNSLAYYAKYRLAWWICLVLASIAMLYVHYFAAFLLAAYGMFYLLAVLAPGREGRRTLILEGLVALAAAVLAYLPWLPNAVRRFQVDASYWQGSLKLDEAIRHIALSFTTGETVLEPQAVTLSRLVFLVAGLCLTALLWTAFKDRRLSSADVGETGTPGTSSSISVSPGMATLFAVIYLVVPVVAVLFLSYRTPKFNPRYLMLASPGLILLLAGGLALPFAFSQSQGRKRQVLAQGLSLVVLAGLLVVSLYAVRNWFEDPAFTKDDWRGAVTFVRARLGEDEAVVLVSGHALPAWRFYSPDLEPVRLPQLEILDVDSVLDIETAGNLLNRGLATRQGAWVVQWQDEVVDPTGVVPYLLGSVGDEVPVEASFWGLGSPQHFRFPDGATFPDEAAIEYPINVNFSNQIELVGFSQPACGPASADGLCALRLFWRALIPLATDIKLSTFLSDGDGHRWSEPEDRRLSAYEYPTFRWEPGTLVLTELSLPVDPGTPPGQYRLWLGLYESDSGESLEVLDSAGAPQGVWAQLAPISVDRLVAMEGQGPSTASDREVAPGLQLLDASIAPDVADPGTLAHLQSWWQISQPTGANYDLAWQWLDPRDQVIEGGATSPTGEAFPTSRWPVGSAVRSQVGLRIPRTAGPGTWTLRIGATVSGAEFEGPTLDLPVTVLETPRTYDAPRMAIDVDQELGGTVRLLGITPDPTQAAAGDTVLVATAWQAIQEMDTSYTSFVHLLDARGSPVAQDDHLPLHGQRQTDTWLAGEVIVDQYELHLPADLPAGSYRLEIGLYDANAPGLPRLRTSEGSDSIIATAVAIN